MPDYDSINVDRRTVLATTTGVSVAGCQSGEQTETQPPNSVNPRQRQTPVTGQQSSRRIGDTVYYDPDNPGPYENGQEALNDVPDGGTFQIAAGEYDVSQEGGRLLIDRPLHIRGSGTDHAQMVTHPDGDRKLENMGTVIVNRDIDKPTIEFRGNPPDKSIRGVSISGVTVNHFNESGPAIRFRGAIYSLIEGARVYTQSAIGVKYEEWSFFARMVRSKIHGASEIGVHAAGNGYAYEFYSNHVGAQTSIQTEVHRTIIVGGEYAAGEDGTSIRFYNPHDHSLIGGVVIEPGIEHTGTHFDIDGESPWENVQIYGSMMLPQGEVPAVRFGNARQAKVIYPALSRRKTGFLAHWTDRSKNCGIVSDPASMQYFDYVVDDGAENPYVHMTGTGTLDQVQNITTGANLSIDHVLEEGSPVFSDGSQWYTLRSASSELQFDG
jgi:hypothetical protein